MYANSINPKRCLNMQHFNDGGDYIMWTYVWLFVCDSNPGKLLLEYLIIIKYWENGFSKISVGINLRQCCGTIMIVHEHKNVCLTYDLKLSNIVCFILLIEAITMSLLVSSFSSRLLRTSVVRAWDQRLLWYTDIKDPYV